MDNIVAGVRSTHTRKIVINGQPYIARNQGDNVTPYYGNFIKRSVAAFYVLFGKGMVVCFSEDKFKPSEIITKVYE